MYKTKYLIINGPPKSGKDTLISLFEQDERYFTIKTSIIDPIKKITNFMEVDMSIKTDKDRELWADLIKVTKKYNNYAFHKTVRFVEESLNYFIPYKDVLVCIVARNPDDIKMFKTFYSESSKVTTILMEREGCVIPNNTEDMSIYDYEYDLIVENNGDLKDLQEAVKETDWMKI